MPVSKDVKSPGPRRAVVKNSTASEGRRTISVNAIGERYKQDGGFTVEKKDRK
jgi:hypothetical protein